MDSSLSEKLRALNSELTTAEQVNFKVLLGLAVGGLIPTYNQPKDPASARAFETVNEVLALLQPYSSRIPPDGIAFRGRPSFMTDDLLAALQNEAAALRPSARRFDEHFLGCGAPIANDLAVSPELTAFVHEHAGPVEPTGVASFLFYDEPGQGIEPHVDTDTFSLNVLLMLKHRRVASGESALVIFPRGRPPQRLILEPGEVVLLFAGSITHGREPIQPNESVSILTFGFRPIVT